MLIWHGLQDSNKNTLKTLKPEIYLNIDVSFWYQKGSFRWFIKNNDMHNLIEKTY